MFKKILIISLAIIALTSIKANAQYLCGSTGYIYRNQGFCNANCSLNGSPSPCETLTPSATSAPTCPSGYEGFVFNPNTNITYAVSTNSQFWTAFNNSTSAQYLTIIPDSATNSLLSSILTYYNIPDAWIGLYNPQMSTDYNTVNPDRPYSWVSGSSSYTNWASNQPNNNLPSQDLSLLPQSEYGQHWIEIGNNGTWNDIGYNYTYPSSQNYAPYLPSLTQFNNQLSCVSGTQPPTPLTSGQETNVANKYCGGNTANCYLCTNGTTLEECQNGTSAYSNIGGTCPAPALGGLCPFSQVACVQGGTVTPTCCNGGTLSTSGSTATCTSTIYACPNGGTPSGTGSNTVCTYTASANPATDYGSISYTPSTIDYSCPSGGTLSGTTCTYTATQTVIPGGFSGYWYAYNSATGEYGDTLVGSGDSLIANAGGWSGSITYSPSSNTFSGQIYNNWPSANNPLFNGSGDTIVGSGGSSQVDSTGTITFNGTDFSGQITWLDGTIATGSGNELLHGTQESYSCPSGGTLSGTTCTYTATATTTGEYYSCPSGGYVSGSSCIYSATLTTSGGGFSGSMGTTYGSGNTIYGAGSYPTGNWWGSITYVPSGNYFYGTLGNAWPTSGNPLYGGQYLNGIAGLGGGADTSGTILFNGTDFSGRITNITGSNPLYGSGSSICDNNGCIAYTPPTQSYSCPNGGSVSGSSCIYSATWNSGSTTYSCPSGGTLSGTTCTYTATSSTTTIYGSISYTPSSIGYSCPSGGTLSGMTCTYTATQTGSPGGFTGSFYSSSTNSPVLTGSGNTLTASGSGTGAWSGSITYSPDSNTFSGQIYNNWPSANNPLFNGSGDTIVGSGGSPQVDMSGAITYNSATNTFSGGIYWLGGSAFTGSSNELLAGTQGYYTYTCPSGGTLSGTTCTYPATSSTTTTPASCSSGYAFSGTECVKETCPASSSSTCVKPTGSSTFYCSPYSCSQNTDNPSYTLNSPNINANNPTDNGTTNSAGQCLGQVYIFSGQAMQCRDPGVQTGWGGGCCTADKKWFGLANCNSQEKLLAQQRAAGDCTMVGTYCAQSFLGYCLQTDQAWCCFPSLLANIIQQQTRANQALPISGWGSAISPDCIGYTPQQFQAINFSQINLSAFYNSIVQQTSSVISNTATNAVNKFQQSLSGQ